MSEGLVVILSGACSVGKKEIANLLLNDPDLKLMKSISMTTRPPKANEVDGKDYYFVDFKDFANAVKQQDLLEYTEFNGWYYGTPKNAVDFLRHNGKNVLIMVEAQGDCVVSIASVTGQMLQRTVCPLGTTTLDATGLPQGMLIVCVEQNDKIISTQRVIKL